MALAVLFVVALSWRLGYLGRLARSPLGGGLTEDAAIYWEWAGALLEQGWLGSNAFFLGPLYPYTLAILRTLFGDSISAMLVVQAVWGAGACVLLADAARRIAGPVAAVVAGVLACFYEPAVFFDGLVLMESLLFALASLLLWWVAKSAPRSGPRSLSAVPAAVLDLAVTGAIIGLMAAGRATSALLLIPAAWLLMPVASDSPRHGLRHGLALALGFGLVAAPIAVRNLAVSGEWIPFTYNAGYNLYVGNNPEANGSFVWITGTHQSSRAVGQAAEGGATLDGREYLARTEGREFGPSASSALWASRAAEYARANLGRSLSLALRKLAMMWNRHEYPQIENLVEYRHVAGPLGLPIAGSFLVLGPLAIAGGWFAWRRGAAGRFLVAYAVTMTLAIAPFFVTDRFRHQLAPAALVLAGIAAVHTVDAWRRPLRRPRIEATLALLVGILIVFLPAPRLSAAKQAWGMAADLGVRWMERGRPDLAIREYQRAIEIESRMETPSGTSAATERAALYHNYANALVRTGRPEQALTWYERAAQAAPDNATIQSALANAYRRADREAEAAAIEARLSGLVGGEALTLSQRGWDAARGGDLAAAESLFARAVAVDPALHDAWAAIVRLQVQTGRAAAAQVSLERARAAGLSAASSAAHEALVAAALGDRLRAERALAAVPPAALANDPVLSNVVESARSLLQGNP